MGEAKFNKGKWRDRKKAEFRKSLQRKTDIIFGGVGILIDTTNAN